MKNKILQKSDNFFALSTKPKTGDTVAPELAAVVGVRWWLRGTLVLLPADILTLAGEAGNLHLKPNTNSRKKERHIRKAGK